MKSLKKQASRFFRQNDASNESVVTTIEHSGPGPNEETRGAATAPPQQEAGGKKPPQRFGEKISALFRQNKPSPLILPTPGQNDIPPLPQIPSQYLPYTPPPYSYSPLTHYHSGSASASASASSKAARSTFGTTATHSHTLATQPSLSLSTYHMTSAHRVPPPRPQRPESIDYATLSYMSDYYANVRLTPKFFDQLRQNSSSIVVDNTTPRAPKLSVDKALPPVPVPLTKPQAARTSSATGTFGHHYSAERSEALTRQFSIEGTEIVVRSRGNTDPGVNNDGNPKNVNFEALACLEGREYVPAPSPPPSSSPKGGKGKERVEEEVEVREVNRMYWGRGMLEGYEMFDPNGMEWKLEQWVKGQGMLWKSERGVRCWVPDF